MENWLIATAIGTIGLAVVGGLQLFYSRRDKKEVLQKQQAYDLNFGQLRHPELETRAHYQCVVSCVVTNDNPHRCTITDVVSFDRDGGRVDITWGGGHDHLGNTIHPGQPIFVEQSVQLSIRQIHGEDFDYMRVRVFHTYATSPTELIFDEYSGLWESIGL